MIDVNVLRRLAGEALLIGDVPSKAGPLAEMQDQLATSSGTRSALFEPPPLVIAAGDVARDPAVTLVSPRDLKRRTWGSEQGRFATLHALAHIEANAVNLALDAVHRFGSMPADYYADWTSVAAEELAHFLLLSERMAAFGGRYGDLGCHDGLWEIAERTAADVARRMGLVPLVFEARGLDVTPGLIERFERHDDPETAAVLRRVLADEVGHVSIGHRWFEYVCAERGLEVWPEFERLVEEAALMVVPPFNTAARIEAGFEPDDLARWTAAFVGTRA